MDVKNIIRFEQHYPIGAARVIFPSIIACNQCGGVRGYDLRDGSGPVVSPEAAQAATAAAMIQQGYNLRANQDTAGTGAFARFDGHDAWPEDWQGVGARTVCDCNEWVTICRHSSELAQLREVA